MRETKDKVQKEAGEKITKLGNRKSSPKNRKKEASLPGIEPDVGVEPTTLRLELLDKSLTLYRLS